LSAFTHVEFIVPLSAICIVGAIATYFFLAKLCPIVYPDYKDEAFLSLYGMLTGTASTGVILLREKDPHFETPAANNIVYQQPWAIAFGFPMLLMLGFAPKGTVQLFATIGICSVLLCVMIVILLRKKIFKKK
ncbi:MAG: hypothetical protein IIX84_07580, partial [Oscillospiraceae bacterium]|nr:hypothetical protein [Oscillospiraceae bacterium]